MQRHSTPDAPAFAYSYIRFSHPDQAKGDSLRRQTEAAADWCRRNKVRLDSSTTLHDLGRSAFTGSHRQNPDRHALAAFLKLVEAGKVPRGSYLVIENLDRLSREHIQPALLLALNLLQAGIRIVQLKPSEIVFDDKSDTLPVMMMMMELSRGHGESAIKAERVGRAWAEKKRLAREKGTVLTHCLPAWVEEVGGRLRLIPGRAAVVRRIFKLAAEGYGRKLTATLLTREKVPAFGPAGHWNGSYIGEILSDRRAIGEFQPCKKQGRVKDGEPIPDYYPAAVTEAAWHAARAGAAERLHKRGRTGGGHVNVFAGLLKNARFGDSFYCSLSSASKGRGYARQMLHNTGGHEGRLPSCSFPYETFERAVLGLLREIDPDDIINGDEAPDEIQVLAGQLAGVRSSIALIEAELNEHGESPALFRRLRAKEDEERALASRLAEAQQKAAHPLSESWDEAKTLLGAVDGAAGPADVRLRLRSALRRVVQEIWMLIVPRGKDRLAAVQVFFNTNRDGEYRRRDYVIYHRSDRNNGKVRKAGVWGAWSLNELIGPGDFDLREKADVAAMEAELAEIDLAELEAELERRKAELEKRRRG
jgi:DNA invertase Pin-like site-specific DNA recombinase